MNESIAHYRIVEKIGQGGMGEVYRATDTKLNREVALKVLPDAFAKDPDRMARFSREAQVLASLNHPNIASIHGLEEAGGTRALVMELVEGETLADRLKRGPLPLEEALTLAGQIAQALEEAHEHGIIHRDLKPANVKVTPAGVLKLLDFGLAKALEGDPGTSSPDTSKSPTMSAATQAGVILGTASYMSPEQARGQKADRKSDVWSFGVVLYEMLTGRRAFVGDTVSDVLASVLKSDLDWNGLPVEVPAPVRDLVRRCLTRDPKQRLQSIGDARIALAECLTRPDKAPETGARSTPRAAWLQALPWGLLLLLGAAFALAPWRRPEEPALRVSMEVGDRPLFLGVGSSVALSPDGRRLAYVAGDDAGRELYVRALDELEGPKLASGTGASSPYHPFFSPDGKWLAYVTPTELRKVPVTGGTPQTLCPLERSRGGSWGPDDTIIFAPSTTSGLSRVSAAGGQPQALTTLDKTKGEATHRWPQVLPGGKAVLFTSHTRSAGDFDTAAIEVLVLASGERKVVHRGGSYGRYVPSGHLVYVNRGTLFAVPFDLRKLEVTGSPAPVVQNVSWDIATGGAQFDFSETGRLVVVSGENTVPEYPVVWVDREGRTSKLWDTLGAYANPRLSPDGKRLSLTVLRDGNWDIWVVDLARGVPTRLTFDDAAETEQVWSPDGQYLVFTSNQGGVDNLYRKRADGSGDIERLTESDNAQWASSWSPDGKSLAFVSAEGGFDLVLLSLEGERKAEKFLSTPFRESSPSFAPNGRWLAYESDESGRREVYVRPVPARGGKWQVSDGGGATPKWSRNGRELFYRTDAGIMVAEVETAGDTFRAGKPRPLFQGSFRGGLGSLPLGGNAFADYDVSADGQRFVMFPAANGGTKAEHPHVTLMTRWFDDLRRPFAAGRN